MDLDLFSKNITAIAKIWVNVQNDATKIHEWLQDGADDAVSCSVFSAFRRSDNPNAHRINQII